MLNTRHVRLYPQQWAGTGTDKGAIRFDIYTRVKLGGDTFVKFIDCNPMFTQPYIAYNPPPSETALSLAPAFSSMTDKTFKIGDDVNNRPWDVINNVYNSNCYWTVGTTHKMVLASNGNLSIDGSLSQNSDRSLKSVLHPGYIENCVDKMNMLQPKMYINHGNGELESGLIAQEVEEIAELSHMVGFNDPHKSVKYTQIISYLIGAVKEMDSRIKHLEGAASSTDTAAPGAPSEPPAAAAPSDCLLYTSDAADE